MTIVKEKAKLKKSTAAKKRLGEHHRINSQHYMKTYWPYLPMVMILAVCLFISNILHSNPHVLGISSDFSNQSFLSATNSARSSENEGDLTTSATLSAAAQNRANDIVKQNYWSHISPSGQTPWQYITASGYSYQLAGENLAYGFSNAKEVVSAWLNSPEHRMNVLNKSFQDVGFGLASSSNFLGKGPATVVVAEYAEPAGSSAVKQTFAPNSALMSRVQILTDGQASWSFVVVAFLTGAVICYFVVRNFKRIKKSLKTGEKFASKHLILDLVLVLVIGIGYILTRTSGFIH